ncbi:sensor histidine kinase [Streptomonospora litoralis]|uniref:histidine kinase n=1 Tax=Streptomonospora litoralis TaxID=2498135 RepID=A0A4P6QAF3_9ACTN|nr:histidine kinase [Streptomonospora litoralis]QBI56499.1 Nitrate/nitrite sensor protein NarX [Streptomonospora litoralis]
MQPLDETSRRSSVGPRADGAVVRGAALWAAFALFGTLSAVSVAVPVGSAGAVSVLAPAMGAAAFVIGRAEGREPAMVGALAVLMGAHSAAAALGGGTVTHAFLAAAAVVVCAVLPWLLGRYLRRRAEAASFGWRRAELLERERDLVAERERLRERARIAEEMHDSLGHELSLVVVRAGAMQVAPDYGEDELRRAAGEVRDGAAGAVERLQEVIGILRKTGDPLAGEPLGQSPGELVERARGAGMDVEVHGAGLLDGQPEAVQRTLYRVVQEALTNAAKHAPGAAVAVRAEDGAHGGRVVRVRNGPARRAGPTVPAAVSGGRGLCGLAERLRQLGGEVEAGARDDGGFEVVAQLPPGAAAPAAGGAGGGRSAEQASRFAASQRRALGAALAAPVALLAVLAAAWLGYYGYVSARSVLEPEEFARLHVGQEQRRVEAVLPAMRMLDPPSERGGAPGGEARCRYYRSEVTLPGAAATAYRLCFSEGRLVAKEAVPVGT